MSVRDTVHGDLVTAMKARNDDEKAALRLLLAALTDAEKLEGKALSETDEHAVVARKLKEANRSIEEYQRLGQTERVHALEREVAIYQRYAPQQLSPEVLSGIIDATIAETGASSAKDLGKVMPAVMAKVGAAASGAEVRRLVQARLSVPAG